MDAHLEAYAGKTIFVTGGAGAIGSSAPAPTSKSTAPAEFMESINRVVDMSTG